MSPPRDPQTVLPLRAAELEVLLALLSGELHGYGLMKAVETQSNGLVRLEVGSLYRVLSRMLSVGLIEPSAGTSESAVRRAGDSGHADKRRYYRITAFGKKVAAAEVGRLRITLKAANALLR